MTASNEINLMYLIVSFNGLLLIIVGYFVRSLISKIDSMQESIISIDKSTALMGSQVDAHERELEHFYDMEKRVDLEIKGIRERLHGIINELNRAMLEIDHMKINKDLNRN